MSWSRQVSVPTRPRRASREPNLEQRATIVTSFDQTRFGVRGANDLPDELGVKYGDRVACYIEGTCVDVIESTKREGTSERTVVIEAYDGHLLRIIDEVVGRKRRRRKRRATAGGASVAGVKAQPPSSARKRSDANSS
jgi:hypothetical protein